MIQTKDKILFLLSFPFQNLTIYGVKLPSLFEQFLFIPLHTLLHLSYSLDYISMKGCCLSYLPSPNAHQMHLKLNSKKKKEKEEN